MHAHRLFAFVLVSLLALPAAALAQLKGDAAEIRNYRLTMDKVRALVGVYEKVGEQAKKDPKRRELAAKEKELDALTNKENPTAADERRMEKLGQEIEALESALDGDADGGSLTDMARSIERNPTLASAVRSAGFKPREFAVAQLALFQAMFTHGLQKSGHLKELPKEVSPENVRFVAQHEVELEKLTARHKQRDER
jgi:hypothetical protein